MTGRKIYIRSEKPAEQQTGSRKYTGDVAAGYDKKREESPKWKEEDRIIKEYLEDVPLGHWVLDCPVGTGRFIPFYEEKGFLIRAVDISEQMLHQATRKVTNQEKYYPSLGDVRDLKFKAKSSNVSLMIRLTRWLMEEGPEHVVAALKELQRVTSEKIIFTARVADHPFAVPYELIEGALDGWEITKDEGLKPVDDWPGDENYRVIMLEPKK